jgi:hypothetical protein
MVVNGMVFYDAKPATRGIKLPAGHYVSEAEDLEYWYFRAPAPVEMKTFQNGRISSVRSELGGVMIAKGWSLLPAAVYIQSSSESMKMGVWKLGKEWLRLEGSEWKKLPPPQ